MLGLIGISEAQDVDPSLVGWWKLDEGSGTLAADSSGNGNDGTLNGPVEWVDGHDGKALSFNGPYNYVLVQDSPSLDMTDAITIAAWINPNWTGNNRILQKSSGGGDNQYRLLKEWGDNMVFHLPGLSPDRLEFPGLPPIGEWTHLAGVYDGSRMIVYYNGEIAGEQDSSGDLGTSDGTLTIGTKHETAPAGDEYHGMLDDIRIYNRGLSQSEIRKLGGNPRASKPAPADRAIYEDTWANISWTAGAFAASHDLYFGENNDDVANGSESVFQGNQATNFLVIGFPGFPYPEGLVPGTTYYWRVDEVNEANPDSPWAGDVWRFTVPPHEAWKPMPPDKAQLVGSETDLSWDAGWGGRMHTVYFGDTFDDVNNATGGTQQLEATYELDALELGKTYYWRVDEFTGAVTYPGDVWSFTTGDASIGGLKAEYFNNLNLVGSPVITQVEPGIDYTWDLSPGPGVGDDDYSVRWTGELNVPFTETYTFYANVQGAIRLSVNGQLLVDFWMPHPMIIEYRGKIDLEVGTVPIVMEFSDWQYDAGEAAVAQLFWENPSLPKEIIPQTALLLPVRAGRARPSNGAVDVAQTPILRWAAGDDAASHQVYFGTDEAAVQSADASSPEYKGSTDLGSESLDPGKLEWNTAYYWRVDEVNDTNPDSPWKGAVVSFTTANYLVVDDLDDYTDNDAAGEAIWQTWVDGYQVIENGATVGSLDPPYAETVVVHGGLQSMPVECDNTTATYSEVELALGGMDLTENGGAALSIWFRGTLANAADPLYVALDGAAISHDDPAAAQIAIWTEWKIPLQAFTDKGVDVTNVGKIVLGLGDKINTGGLCTMYFDDIAVH
ncbi:MAG: hypothetical protein ISS70_22900 [Phycisphaerae bacterium]|nr:hypothetical protein [Phycisphaerae bacterium]